MPISGYGVLKGRAVDARDGSGANPHFQIRIVDATTEYRVAVNVRSQDGSEVLFVVAPSFRHPMTEALHELAPGFTRLASKPGGLALDFIRANLFDPRDMVPLPISAPGPDNDLNEKVGHYARRAMADEAAMVYAFGQRWGPEPQLRDKIFGFLPGNGVHDVHMNQGNDRTFAKDDGVWQDGGLLLEFPGQQQWVGIFLKFQSQAWHTDDATGHPITAPTPPLETEGVLRIVGARVNDKHAPERETVTLLNASDRDLDLTGWRLADTQKNRMALDGRLAAGGVRTFDVRAPMALSNQGGIITLLDGHGLKVDGVSYTKRQARPGWTVTFR